MAEILLFHHAQGLTDGVHGFAASLRQAGHVVHTPDLYDGHVFGTLDDGLGYARSTGFQQVVERGLAAADGLSAGVVFAGFSLGVMPAQQLAQTAPGARGAVLMEACAPVGEFSEHWPDGVPVQVHGMDADPFFAEEGDLDAARALVAEAADGELFLYPGDQHLFTDSSLPSFDPSAGALLTQRVLTFLDGLDAADR